MATLQGKAAITTLQDGDFVSVHDISSTAEDAAGDLKKITVANLDTHLAATTKTLTNKTLTAPVVNGSITGTGTLGKDLLPTTDSTYDLGASGTAFAEGHFDTIYIGGTEFAGTALTDPNADRMLFWDDSAGSTAYLAPGTGLSITTTSLNAEVSLTNTATLTNKTLTAPDITDPTIAHEYNAQTGTTYTLVAADQSAIVTMNNVSANTLTIPPNSSVAFPVGTKVEIWALGAGTTTIAGGTGVTLQGNGGSASAGSCDIQTRYGGATLTKIATDTWMVGGDIDAVA